MALTLPRTKACPLWERAGMRESTEPPPPWYVARTPNAFPQRRWGNESAPQLRCWTEFRKKEKN